MSEKVVVIGSGPAGIASALSASENSREVEIVTAESFMGYCRCFLPLLLTREVNPRDASIIDEKELMKRGIAIRKNTVVEEIDPGGKVIETSDGKIEFDRLIICPGSGEPHPAKIKGSDKDNVIRLYRYEDGLRLARMLKTAGSIAIIGSFFVGMEALLIAMKKYRVTLVDTSKNFRLLNFFLDDYIREPVISEITAQQNVEIRLGVSRDDMEIDDSFLIINGEKIRADIVIDATERYSGEGIKVAENAGIEIGKTGGIKVSGKMETSVEDVYSAGECTEYINFLGYPQRSVTEPVAVKEGRIAGYNATGINMELEPLVIPNVIAYGNIQFGWTGIVPMGHAESLGIKTIVGKGEGYGLAKYMPSNYKTRCLLIFDSSTMRLIGGEVYGERDVKWRIDLLTMAIKKGLTAEDLVSLELGFMPAVAGRKDPIVISAEDAMNKM